MKIIGEKGNEYRDLGYVRKYYVMSNYIGFILRLRKGDERRIERKDD